MCQYRFTLDKKKQTNKKNQKQKQTNKKPLVSDGGRYACIGQGIYGKYLYLPLNFAGNLKLFLKKKSKMIGR